MKQGVEIYSTDEGELYEWNEFHVFRNEDGELHADQDSGCSCDSYEYPTQEQWNRLAQHNRAEVIAKFSDWASFMSPFTKTRELERLVTALNK